MFSKPTAYNGVLFRSKTEARWAAFFDILSIGARYDKNKNGMRMRSTTDVPMHCVGDPAVPCSPDFWLSKQKAWVEIKGSASQVEPSKYIEFVNGIGQPLFCIIGTPWPGSYSIHLFGPNPAYPVIRKGLFAEHQEKKGWWIAEHETCAPFRKVFVREPVDRTELIVHSERLLAAMKQAYDQFKFDL